MDAALRTFRELEDRGVDLIDAWIESGHREDLHLDFKRKAKPRIHKLDDDDRRNLSRALSGFANSDGGIIVWGVGAPGSGTGERSKHPIYGVTKFAEVLDSFLSRYVTPAVDGARNLVIYEDIQRDCGYVATYVPKSDTSPHRAESEGLKQYYKRYGDSFKIAEHYELEYMFGKRLVPHLKVFWDVDTSAGMAVDSGDLYKIYLRIGLTNQGKAIARYACLRMRYDHKSPYQLDHSHDGDLIHYSEPTNASRKDYFKVTARARPGLVIYPNDFMFFFSFNMDVTSAALESNNLSGLKLYYDLYAENFAGQARQTLSLSGRKIAEKIRKKLGD